MKDIANLCPKLTVRKFAMDTFNEISIYFHYLENYLITKIIN
jgi:hypothetical protein